MTQSQMTDHLAENYTWQDLYTTWMITKLLEEHEIPYKLTVIEAAMVKAGA